MGYFMGGIKSEIINYWGDWGWGNKATLEKFSRYLTILQIKKFGKTVYQPDVLATVSASSCSAKQTKSIPFPVFPSISFMHNIIQNFSLNRMVK